jgi:hypothetical protein
MLPNPPPIKPQITLSMRTLVPSAAHDPFSTISVVPIRIPTNPPPTTDTVVPNAVTPPFVPGGTVLNVVISLGLDRAKIPSSDASVSPRQHAK